MKCIVLNYNRITLLQNTCEWCASHGLDVIIVDNASDYEPLLEWYKSCPYRVVRMDKNYGHRVVWEQWLFKQLGISADDFYILSDPDLEFSSIPDDFLEVMQEGFRRYPKVQKVGFSLEIDDLPDTELGKQVYKHELRFWQNPKDELFYEAEVDTTFAMCRVQGYSTYNCLRIAPPYSVRHLAWYYDDIEKLPIDEKNYIETANESFSWKEKIIK